MTKVAFSADDRYLLSGTWHGRGIKIWDVETGKEHDFLFRKSGSILPTPHPTKPDVFLTNKNRSLEFMIGSISQSAPNQTIDHPKYERVWHSVFSPSADLLAVKTQSFELILSDPVNFLPITEIRTLNSARLISVDFSPDGEQLALSCFHNLQFLHLGHLRAELRGLNLDWN